MAGSDRGRGAGLTPILLIFDIDGTLIDGAGAGRVAMDTAFAQMFGVPGNSRQIETAGRTDRAIFAEMGKRAGVPLHTAALARLQQQYLAALPAALVTQAALLLPGAAALVSALERDPRCRLAIGTGNIEAGARIKLHHFGLDSAFPTGGYGDDSEHRPTVIATALRHAAIHYGENFVAADAVVIGDAPLDVEAARAAGMRMLGVGTGRGGPAPLAQAKPDVLFPDLMDTRRILGWLLD